MSLCVAFSDVSRRQARRGVQGEDAEREVTHVERHSVDPDEDLAVLRFWHVKIADFEAFDTFKLQHSAISKAHESWYVTQHCMNGRTSGIWY